MILWPFLQGVKQLRKKKITKVTPIPKPLPSGVSIRTVRDRSAPSGTILKGNTSIKKKGEKSITWHLSSVRYMSDVYFWPPHPSIQGVETHPHIDVIISTILINLKKMSVLNK